MQDSRVSMSRRPIVPLVTGALFAFACVAWLKAGPLNPPTGPVIAGGKTTQEIFDAVTANSLATGAIGGRGPAVPGGTFSGGTFTFATTPVVSGPILGLRSAAGFSAAFTGGTLVGGTTSLTSLTLVRDMGTGDGILWKAVTSGTVITSGTITVPCTGGNTVCTLGNFLVNAVRHTNIQRADGTYAAVEEIDLFPTTMRVTDPAGNTWQFNFGTRTGTP